MPEKTTVHDPKACQVCREVFPSTSEKAIHVSLEHDLGRNGTDTTLKFAACVACGARTYLTLGVCECGQPMQQGATDANRSL